MPCLADDRPPRPALGRDRSFASARGAVVTDACSYPPATNDPIPAEIDGEPVLRGGAIEAHVAAAIDDTSFLVGGFIGPYFIVDCFVPPDFPRTPLLSECGQWPSLLQETGSTQFGLQLVSNGVTLVPVQFVVLRVHVHDPLAAECPDDYRERCERAVVVEELLWTATARPDLARAKRLALADPRFVDYLAANEHDEPVAEAFVWATAPGGLPGMIVSVQFASPVDDYPLGSCDIYRRDERVSGIAWFIHADDGRIGAVTPIWVGGINCFGGDIPGYVDRSPSP